ncbi:MAG: diaminopimelate epimerase [Nitriliruptoraceae bacterium]
MRRTLSAMEFTRAHGTANDFVVLPDLDDGLELTAELARALADRRRGLGGDGVIRVAAPPQTQPDAQVFMDHRNADGSLAEMCGNGVRVLAKYVVDRGLVAPDDEGRVHVATRGGTRTVWIVERHADGRVASVAVDMGPPQLEASQVPFVAADPTARRHRVELEGAAAAAVDADHLDVAVVSMGNPHAVVSVASVADAPVAEVGPAIERHHRFPNGANIGFVEVVDHATLRLRVFERGVGETAACGTGACAAVVAAQLTGAVGERVAVHLPGGVLTIEHRDGGTVMMTGPAVEIAHGQLDEGWLADLAVGARSLTSWRAS